TSGVAFNLEPMKNSLAEMLSLYGLPTMLFSESERSMQVDYLSGPHEDDESRSLYLRSVEPAHWSAKPEMASFKLTDRFISQLDSGNPGFYVINLSASALVSEAGDLKKTIEAVQFVDTCLGGIIDKVQDRNGVAIVTASHAGCETMR